MRVLLALDGSAEADRARALAASIDWPAGTVIEVVSVLRPILGLGFGRTLADSADPARADHETVVTDACALLEATSATVRGVVLTGRPASVIVDEAAAFRADLVVVGSRGFGPIPTMVLGSVSAEVVDRSPCPVLVVRGDDVRSIVLGIDGSETADGALDFLIGFRLFEGRPVTVASVIPSVGTVVDPLGGVAMGMYEGPPGSFARSADEALRQHEGYASKAAIELREAGYPVEVDLREGDPAHALIELAKTREAPLIVLGTHGRTGIQRAVLGSVARNVLLHAVGSVLIVRGPVRERIVARVATAVAQGVVLGASI
jgi:nucleotide-binding universal stress UspA family protein